MSKFDLPKFVKELEESANVTLLDKLKKSELIQLAESPGQKVTKAMSQQPKERLR